MEYNYIKSYFVNIVKGEWLILYIVAFMFVLPMGFEIFSEQSKILAKIQMQMMNDNMMGGMGGMDAQPTIRPFWDQ